MPLRRTLTLLLPLLTLAAPMAACEREEAPPPVSRQAPLVPLDTGTVWIETETDTFTLSVEIAETPEQREIGLMERTALPQEEGMIFLYPEPQDTAAGFWMFRTRIPLDIAYLDQQGRIVAIRQMEPCPSPDRRWCPTYPPGVEYNAALEVNRGYFSERGIGIGDRVTLRRAGGAWPEEVRGLTP